MPRRLLQLPVSRGAQGEEREDSVDDDAIASSGSFATGGIDGKVKLWSFENLDWPIFVQSVSKGTWVTSLVWVDGGSKRQAAQGRKSKGGSQSEEGRPAIVFTLDDGRVGTLAMKQMVQRWIFAREFTLWDSM